MESSPSSCACEILRVLYDYEYDYKDRKISIIKDEKLKLIQRTNEHWWKVIRPGINRAFFVPASYVDLWREDKDDDTNHHEEQNNSSKPGSLNNSINKIKRNDSSRTSKRSLKLSNWSASLEELSKQIIFPGINSTNTNESGGSSSSTALPQLSSNDELNTSLNNNSKPVPLPRNKSSSSSSDVVAMTTSESSMRKPIPKTRSTIKTERNLNSTNPNSSGGSNELLMSSSNEELLQMDSCSSDNEANNDSYSSMLSKVSRESFRHELPAIPTSDIKPNRQLTNNWYEYISPSDNRLYYYNNVTHATSWKPPRTQSMRHMDSSLEEDNSLLQEDRSVNNNQSDINNSSRANSKSPTASGKVTIITEENEAASAQLPATPNGWSCTWDELNEQYIYYNNLTGSKWLSSQDSEGKIYYYEENSNKSTWFLPPVPDSESGAASRTKEDGSHEKSHGESSSTQPNKPSTSTSAGIQSISRLMMPDVIINSSTSTNPNSTVVKKRHSLGTELNDRILKSKSMLILSESTSRKGDQGTSKMDSLPRHQPQFKSIWSTTMSRHDSTASEDEVIVLKEGSLNRTKITENGKKLRKNWISNYAVLTEQHLSFFRDQKAFASRKPELEIELAGCTIDYTTDKSSRRNVFQLNTYFDLQLLLQSDDVDVANDWIECIKEVIRNQPAHNYLRLRSTSPESIGENSVIGEKKSSSSRLGRVKSTKLKITGSMENLSTDIEKHRIRAQLRKFFIRRPARESLVKKGIYKDESVFGCHLNKLCARENTVIPNFVQECVTAIESKEENLKTDGLYRASGNLSQVQKIRLQVDQNNLSCLYQEDDVHVLAGALKLFFREMKEPLIPCELFEDALKASNLPSRKEKIQKFHEIIKKLGKPNRATLQLLLKHLLKVAEYSDYNRMQIPNLAIVFGPTLMWPAIESSNMALDLMQQNFVIESILLDYNEVFL